MSKAKTYTFAGKTLTAKQWAELTGIKATKISHAMGRGGCKTLKQALNKLATTQPTKEAVAALSADVKRGRPALEEQVVQVDLKAGKYTIVRRTNHAVEAYKGTKQTEANKVGKTSKKFKSAKAVLRQVIEEKDLKVELGKLNTRQLGKNVIDALQG
jgi:hypothetical protein